MRALRIIALATLCVVLVISAINIVLWYWRSEFPKPAPPPLPPDLSDCIRDLTDCVRVEIQYFPADWWDEPCRVNVRQTPRVNARPRFVVDDRERVRAFAATVARGLYDGPVVGRPSCASGALVTWHFRERPSMRSMGLGGLQIYTLYIERKHRFRYDEEPLDIVSILGFGTLPSEENEILLGLRCARNLTYLSTALKTSDGDLAYPSASAWCDAIVDRYRDQGDAAEWYMKHFVCPAVWQGGCHYAMNPNCEPNSPPDTVLLFETEAGWNQHGGPELFTFDNHNPRGGLVLLNDGSVKLIRAEDELKQLRWE